MARVNVYLPDDLADAAREAQRNVSGIAQAALKEALAERDTNRWLDSIARLQPTKATHIEALDAVHAARDQRGPETVADLVVDASAMVDALAGTPLGPAVTKRPRDQTMHAPHTSTPRFCQRSAASSEPVRSTSDKSEPVSNAYEQPRSSDIDSRHCSRGHGAVATISDWSTPSTYNSPTTSASHS